MSMIMSKCKSVMLVKKCRTHNSFADVTQHTVKQHTQAGSDKTLPILKDLRKHGRETEVL